jgi:phosphonate transport system permease protein
MPTATKNGLRVWQRRERGRQLAIWAAWLFGTACFVYCFQLVSDRSTWFFVTDAGALAADLG